MNTLIIIYIFIFGSVIGSFLNCLIWRLHTEESIWGRSYCPKCNKKIAWHDNIPIFSFLLLGGKCRKCKNKISWQYPLVELIAGLLFVLIFLKNFNYNFDYLFFVQLFKNLLLVCVMIIIFVYDLRWYLILDVVTLPISVLFFILNLFLGFTWLNLIIAGIFGASFFLVQFLISQGKWIGGGDIRLGFLMGIALGKLSSLLLAIFLGYIIGSIVGILLIISGNKKWGSQLPLGVFLALGTIITILWGDFLIDWYLSIL